MILRLYSGILYIYISLLPVKIFMEKNSQSGFSSLLVLALIVIVLIGAGVFIYNKQNAQTASSLTPSPSAAPVVATATVVPTIVDTSDTTLDEEAATIDGKLGNLDTDAVGVDQPVNN